MDEKKRGGTGRGQGRKPLAKTGELMKARPVRMTDEEWAKCKRLGGAAWVRGGCDVAAKAVRSDCDIASDLLDGGQAAEFRPH